MTVLRYNTMVTAKCTELVVPRTMEPNQDENHYAPERDLVQLKKQTEFTTMMRTIKHHYLFKVYLPMYRLIYQTPEERFRNKNEVRILNVTEDHNHTRKLETCPAVRPRTLLPTLVPNSRRFVTLKNNRSRNCVHIMKLIPEYPNLNNNGEVVSPTTSPESSPCSSTSSSCASSPASTPRSLSPPLLSPTDLEHYSKHSVTFYSQHIIQSKFHEHLRRKYTKYNNRNDLKTLILQSRRNDREEIRRKLAMGSDDMAPDSFYGGGGGGGGVAVERGFKKPSMAARLQSGMHLHGNNLQICFMNEATSDHEGQGDTEDKSQVSAIKEFGAMSGLLEIFSKAKLSTRKTIKKEKKKAAQKQKHKERSTNTGKKRNLMNISWFWFFCRDIIFRSTFMTCVFCRDTVEIRTF